MIDDGRRAAGDEGIGDGIIAFGACEVPMRGISSTAQHDGCKQQDGIVPCSRSGSSSPAVSQTHYTHHSKKVVQSGGAKSAQAGVVRTAAPEPPAIRKAAVRGLAWKRRRALEDERHDDDQAWLC